MLQSMGLQRVGHDRETELNWHRVNAKYQVSTAMDLVGSVNNRECGLGEVC